MCLFYHFKFSKKKPARNHSTIMSVSSSTPQCWSLWLFLLRVMAIVPSSAFDLHLYFPTGHPTYYVWLSCPRSNLIFRLIFLLYLKVQCIFCELSCTTLFCSAINRKTTFTHQQWNLTVVSTCWSFHIWLPSFVITSFFRHTHWLN